MDRSNSPTSAQLKCNPLSQQVLSDLQQVSRGDPRERRRQALADLQALAQEQIRRLFDPSLEDLIRQDRSR